MKHVWNRMLKSFAGMESSCCRREERKSEPRPLHSRLYSILDFIPQVGKRKTGSFFFLLKTMNQSDDSIHDERE